MNNFPESLAVPPEKESFEYHDVEPEEEFPYGSPALDLKAYRERQDATAGISLFQDVIIDSDFSFTVPDRYLDANQDGIWILSARGVKTSPKEHDDYGHIRTMSSGVHLWVPHLYPFEEVGNNGLPLIIDRDRCKLTVELKLAREVYEEPKKAINISLSTHQGTYFAGEDSLSWFGNYVFNEFENRDQSLISDAVTYPEIIWDSLSKYLIAKNPEITLQEWSNLVFDRNAPQPEEFLQQFVPESWQNRKPSGYQGAMFGAVMVPLDVLYTSAGQETTVQFPCFQ